MNPDEFYAKVQDILGGMICDGSICTECICFQKELVNAGAMMETINSDSRMGVVDLFSVERRMTNERFPLGL